MTKDEPASAREIARETEIAAMIERLEAWEPLVSSGYEVPAAGRSMLEAAAMLREAAAERDALAVAEQNAFNQRNMALDELKLAEAERDRLAAMVEKLREGLADIAALNDLSEAPEDEIEAYARGNLHECELLARATLQESENG